MIESIVRTLINKLKRIILCFKGNSIYHKQKKTYIKMSKDDKRFRYEKKNEIPRKYDRYANAGTIDIHYFLQDIWMAKKVINNIEGLHYDIGSRVDGFISHLLVNNISVNMIDIRPLPQDIPNLSFTQSDATNLNGIPDETIESLSSLHAIEHFGLGRYGDSIDTNAWEKALLSMQRVLKKGGMLYLSAPVGKYEKVCFNAHRVYDINTFASILSEMELKELAIISNYKVIEIDLNDINQCRLEDEYACGMYIFEKK